MQLHALLKEKFGFETFRKGQREAIEALLHEGKLLCIQPTGHGKSLLYQLPSCILGGTTLVISPLLALMRDQIDQLKNRFQIPAASINSDQSDEENALAMGLAASGKLQVLFVSPEQLSHIDRAHFLQSLPLTLVVIDEAHCISTWGHDFRPSYRQILPFISRCGPDVKILALTATADARVEKDIQKQLGDIPVHRESMNRPNIHLSVLHSHGSAEKLALCKPLLEELDGSGLIYCATRENTELVASYLAEEAISTIAYHAGLDSEEKRRIQTAFSNDHYKVVVATTALGMGIDKSNLRFVIHFDIPGSITSYYQEVGRAGRDGHNARGILLYDSADRKIQQYFIDSALPSREDFEKVLEAIRTAEEPPHFTEIKRLTGLHPTRVLIALHELVEQQFLKKSSAKGTQKYAIDQEDQPLDLSRYTAQYEAKTEELESMLRYATQSTHCRMAILREALGDIEPTSCGHCDICLGTLQKRNIATDALSQALRWLNERPLPISPSKTHRLSEGVSLLDGKLRTPLFIRFMKERAHSEEFDPSLLQLILKQVSLLPGPVGAIIPLPSSTWKAKDPIANALGKHLGAPVLSSLLSWKTPPEKRQGELLNNDQRSHNVEGKMQIDKTLPIPSGPLLLLDDYIGSGATMKEAARALRTQTDQPLIPFTIAAIKWRLGSPGFV